MGRAKLIIAALAALASVLLSGSAAASGDGMPAASSREKGVSDIVRPIFERLIHVPGPNPILSPGGPGEWDEENIEMCGVFKDGHTYYLYYHGIPGDKERWGVGEYNYKIGVATATHPLGPWKKHGDAPIVDRGPEGSWDSVYVACAAVLKERENSYYMWYSGTADGGSHGIGLATADNPLGPWTKYEKNPVMAEDFGYLGGVVKVDGKYYMYSAHPIESTSPDEGPFALATADRPEGPWKIYEGNPVLPAGNWGAWDDGGFSEAGMLYHEGVFHTFYGGAKWGKLESIGYAYSFDGKTFHKHPANPVVMREHCPDTPNALAEVHALFEPPLFYLYHTDMRGPEHIGVQVLATSVPFRFDMPLMALESLGPGGVTELDDCPLIGTENVNSLALTVECSYGAAATAGLRVKVFPSYDGLHYDTEPFVSFENHFQAGQLCRRTVAVDPLVKFAKVVLENLDGSRPVSDVKVVATLGSL